MKRYREPQLMKLFHIAAIGVYGLRSTQFFGEVIGDEQIHYPFE
jgi:hypothetical protein